MGIRIRETMSYAGRTRADAEAAYHADAARAASVGYAWVDARWDAGTADPTITVTYEYRPPPVVVRSIAAHDAFQASQLFADDAAAMARAGYVPTSQSWADGEASAATVALLGVAGLALRGQGVHTATYTYQPEVTGSPSEVIPPLPRMPGPNMAGAPTRS